MIHPNNYKKACLIFIFIGSYFSINSCTNHQKANTLIEIENQSIDIKEINLSITIDDSLIEKKSYRYYQISPSPYFLSLRLNEGAHKIIVKAEDEGLSKTQYFVTKKETYIQIFFKYKLKSKEKIEIESLELGDKNKKVDSILIKKELDISISDKIPEKSL